MTCYEKITCPKCDNTDIMRAGLNASGVQRYRCQNPDCLVKTFMLNWIFDIVRQAGKQREGLKSPWATSKFIVGNLARK